MNIEQYISTGILEKFVFGRLGEKENAEVLALAKQYPAVKSEIDEIEKSLETVSRAYTVAPPASMQGAILAAIRKAETPPLLTVTSKLSDYNNWFEKFEDPKDYDSMHMEVIDQTPEATMVIAWVKSGEPDHLHTDYTEIFLIAEGTCRATIDGVTSDYGPGDYVEFPIDQTHSYEVTSNQPMKVVACLLNRAA